MKMTEKVCVQKKPFAADVVAGNTYYFCSCGLSKTQPFCDGAHKGSGLKSIHYLAEETKTVYFCGCKQSKLGAVCDGTHKTL
jgi:CDGSH iron-sulfur domain-containing protein 3